MAVGGGPDMLLKVLPLALREIGMFSKVVVGVPPSMYQISAMKSWFFE
jgi:hypothetical protein